MRKQMLTIGETAKLTSISAETLRYYDRIKLFSPSVTDSVTSYRYYTPDQLWSLRIIKQLREMDTSIPDIKNYLENKRVASSLEIMRKNRVECERRICAMRQQEERLSEKIRQLESFAANRINIDAIYEKSFDERQIFTLGISVDNGLDFLYSPVLLEKALDEVAPAIAGNYHGFMIPQEDLFGKSPARSIAFCFYGGCRRRPSSGCVKRIKAARFVCGYYSGRVWDRADCLARLMKYIKEKDFRVAGDAVQIGLIEDTVTDDESEFLYEIQIPVV